MSWDDEDYEIAGGLLGLVTLLFAIPLLVVLWLTWLTVMFKWVF